jgi:hypothetical protein
MPWIPLRGVAKAGVQFVQLIGFLDVEAQHWIPAFAGTTILGVGANKFTAL